MENQSERAVRWTTSHVRLVQILQLEKCGKSSRGTFSTLPFSMPKIGARNETVNYAMQMCTHLDKYRKVRRNCSVNCSNLVAADNSLNNLLLINLLHMQYAICLRSGSFHHSNQTGIFKVSIWISELKMSKNMFFLPARLHSCNRRRLGRSWSFYWVLPGTRRRGSASAW